MRNDDAARFGKALGQPEHDGESQTYLRVAETVLGKSRSPLKAREIVERGIDQGLFGDHAMSRTPEKSMQARLSVHILAEGKNSKFARTGKGRFTLRTRLQTSRNSDDEIDQEYVAQRRAQRSMNEAGTHPKEEVLCVTESHFKDVLTFQGIDTESSEILGRLLHRNGVVYVPRSEAESKDDAKQFITYVLVQCGQRLLFFKRSYISRAAEFLRGSRCIGFGGHVSAADFDILTLEDRGLSLCARRELAEELWLPPSKSPPSKIRYTYAEDETSKLFQNAPLERLGILNDDSSEVGRRHVAVVYRVWLTDWDQVSRLQKGDSSIKGVGWIDLSNDTLDISEFEYWSQLCLRKFYPSTIFTKTKLQVVNHSQLVTDKIIAVSGRIGSGKSETANYLSQRLGIPHISSGAVVAHLMGSPPIQEIGREEFQRRAQSFIEQDEGFARLAQGLYERSCQNVGRCIVDGIRNLETFEQLRALSRDSTALIFVQTPPDVCYEMFRAREAAGSLMLNYRDFLRIFDASVESEIPSLGRVASAVLYNSFGIDAFRRTLDDVVKLLS